MIVSAGPSLERHFDLLNEIGNQALIIAPGTGARILDQRGIRAHLVMAVDSSEAEADIFKSYRGACPLVGSFRLHPRIDEEFPNPILRLATSSDRLAQYYYRHFQNENFAMIDDHPSVSNCAIDYAFKLGCNPIILIGQDLCYYENKLHADEEAVNLPGSRTKISKLLDINGLPVVTNNAFLAMRYELETQTQQYKGQVQLINATEAGLGVPGIANRRFRDVIDHYIVSQRSDVAEMVAAIISRTASNNAGNNDHISGFYEHLLDQIDFIERKNRDKGVLLRKLNKLQKRDLKLSRLIEHMTIINEINSELEKNNFYQEVIRAGLNAIIQYRLVAVECTSGSTREIP